MFMGWEQVRYIPGTLDGWEPSDILAGTESYGDKNQENENKAWAIPFSLNRDYIEFKV